MLTLYLGGTSMETLYKAVAEWTGTKPPEWISKIVFEGLMSVWNDHCKILNPVIELLNEKYSGPLDGTDENGYMRESTESQYIKYLQDGTQRALEQAQDQGKFPKKGMFIKRFIIDNHMQLAAVAYNGAQVTMVLQPVQV